jgi:LPXTG-site transpeptidase (sortase) family protein
MIELHYMTENKPENNSIWQELFKNKFYFALVFVVVFTVTFSFLYLFGLVPAEFNVMIGRYPDQESKGILSGDLPLSIKIPEIGVDTQVYNPATTSISVLDNFLLKGAVRYPGSGLLGGNGNIFVFGHSTGYKIVQNQAYKTFNHIQDLKIGNEISVYSDKAQYVYKVTSVRLESADKALITFNTKDHLLTLSTCNSFGEKTDRYVVEAEFAYKK